MAKARIRYSFGYQDRQIFRSATDRDCGLWLWNLAGTRRDLVTGSDPTVEDGDIIAMRFIARGGVFQFPPEVAFDHRRRSEWVPFGAFCFLGRMAVPLLPSSRRIYPIDHGDAPDLNGRWNHFANGAMQLAADGTKSAVWLLRVKLLGNDVESGIRLTTDWRDHTSEVYVNGVDSSGGYAARPDFNP